MRSRRRVAKRSVPREGVDAGILMNHIRYDLAGNFLLIRSTRSIEAAVNYINTSLDKLIIAHQQNRIRIVNHVRFYDIW